MTELILKFAVDVQGVKDLGNAFVFIQKADLRDLMIPQYQRSNDAIFQMLFCNLVLLVLMILSGLTSWRNLIGKNQNFFFVQDHSHMVCGTVWYAERELVNKAHMHAL